MGLIRVDADDTGVGNMEKVLGVAYTLRDLSTFTSKKFIFYARLYGNKIFVLVLEIGENEGKDV